MSDRNTEAVGYLVSILSVVMLAYAAWQGTVPGAPLRYLVIAGAGLSIIGMTLRWLVFWRRHGRKHRKDH